MPVDQEIRKINPTQSVLIHYFQLADGTRVARASTADGQPFVLNVTYADGTGYQRIDLIGDGSFLDLWPLSTDLKLPHWVRFPEPLVLWRI